MKKYLLALIVLLAGQTAWSQCTADAGPEFILTCNTVQVTLQGSSNIPAATYSWSGPGGFTSNLQNPVVTEAGSYSLTITDPSDGCTATALTGVFLNNMPPLVNLSAGVLTCVTPTITINASVSPANCVFEWSGPNGYISQFQNPAVNEAGLYTVTVTNPSNGCTTVESVAISQDIAVPDVSATGGTIGCSNPMITLSGSSNTPGVTFLWSGPGNFLSNAQNPQTNQIGNYTLMVTAPNGCTATAVVAVTQDGTIPVVIVNETAINCFGGSDGAIDITVTGGIPPYTYLWSDGSTTKDLNNLPAGTYTVTITDNTDCSAQSTIILTQPLDITLAPGLIINSPVLCFGQANGAITIPTPTGGTPGFTYSWAGPNSFSASSKNITGLNGGLYTLTITDSWFCTKTYQFIVAQPAAPLTIQSSYYCGNSVSVNVTGGTPPYQYQWRLNDPNGPIVSNSPNPTNLIFGNYFLIVTDINSCTITTPYTIGPNGTSCTRITGQIIFDENENCAADPGEFGLGNWFLKAEGPNGTFYGLSETDGQYIVTVVPGDYTLSLIPQGYQPTICQNDIPVSILQSGDSTEVDFLVQLSDPDCPSLSVFLTTSVLRRCFDNNYYYLQVCNNGIVEVTDAYFTLELDPFLEIQNAEIPYTDLGNNLYRFELGTLPPNFCDNFWVRVKVNCNAVLGQIHCSEAHVYPDSLCAPVNPQWSGAQLEVKSECAGDSLRFIFKNIGIGTMTNALDYIVIEDGIMGRQGTVAPLQAGGTMTVSVPANGATWRIEAEQEAFSPLPNQPWLSVEGCSNTGSFSTGFVNQFPLSNSSAWVDVDCTPNIGSFDPNDKQGFPSGYGTEHYIRPGTELEYLIRFQNTGTDTAFNVVLRDTLSQWLDPLTVRPGVSSHPYRFELTGKGTLIFDFKNIMLPDSNINERESHGFVRFSISPRSDVPLETDIPNSAAIYFDFNAPVITNTTMHRIGINFVSVGLWQPVQALYKVQVAPHPVQEASWITLSSPTVGWSGNFSLQIFDLLGRPVRRQESSEAKFLLRKSELPAGVYLFKIENEGVLMGSGKLVVR